MKQIFKSALLSTVVLSSIVSANTSNEVLAISSSLDTTSRTFNVKIDFEWAIMWARAKPGSAYDGGEWCFNDLMKVDGAYTDTCTSITLSNGRRLEMEVRNLPLDASVYMDKDTFVDALEYNFTLRTDEYFYVNWDNDTDEKFCQLRFPRNGAMQNLNNEECETIEPKKTNWLLSYNFKSSYSPTENTLTLTSELYGTEKSLTKESIRMMDMKGKVVEATDITAINFQLFKVNGHYFPAHTTLLNDGTKLSFQLINLPDNPAITITWDDYYRLFMHRFRKPNGRIIEITRGVKRVYKAASNGDFSDTYDVWNHNQTGYTNAPGFSTLWENSSISQWNTETNFVKLVVEEIIAQTEADRANYIIAMNNYTNATAIEQSSKHEWDVKKLKIAAGQIEVLLKEAEEAMLKIHGTSFVESTKVKIAGIESKLLLVIDYAKVAYPKSARKGYWKYPVLKGLRYSTSIYNYKGITTDTGEYLCQPNEVVTFSLGIVKIYTVNCTFEAPFITMIKR